MYLLVITTIELVYAYPVVTMYQPEGTYSMVSYVLCIFTLSKDNLANVLTSF